MNLIALTLHFSCHCCCIVVKKTPRCPYGTVSSPSGCLHFPPASDSENSEYAKATWQTAKLKCEHESGFLGQLATPTNMEDLYSLNALRNMYGMCCFLCQCRVVFSLCSIINRISLLSFKQLWSRLSHFDRILYERRWEFQVHKKITPMLKCSIIRSSVYHTHFFPGP